MLLVFFTACGGDSVDPTQLESGKFTVFYYTSWTSPNIHHNAGGTWTDLPGVAMTKVADNWFKYVFPAEQASGTFSVCFNDNGSNWDSLGGSNYNVTAVSGTGVWIVNGEILTNASITGTSSIVVHYQKSSIFTGTPALYYWTGSATGTDVASVSNDSFGQVYSFNVDNGAVYDFKFREGTTWEADAQEKSLGLVIANQEVWVYLEHKGLFSDDPTASIISNPASTSITNKLGAEINGSDVNFVFFAPSSTSVGVRINSGTVYPMKLTSDGKLWWATVSASAGDSYKFILNGTTEVSDPYARANKYSNEDSYVIDPSAVTMTAFTRPELKNCLIYELHVGDMTSGDSTVSATYQGKYLGLTNKIPYLKAMGVNVIEIMPMQEFPGAGYSWGYNNSLYFAPESDYATGYAGEQVTEFKQMVNAFHAAGIAVILDVVYNHVANSDNHLWAIDSDYYFDPAGTDWGNKFYVSDSRPMVKRFVKDNLRYWMEEYNIDGFRFDGVWEIDRTVLKTIISSLKTEGYSDRLYIAELFGSGDFYGTGVATWSSDFRDNAKSHVKSGVSQVGDYPNPAGVVYYCSDKGYNAGPHEALIYLESHDEETMGSYFGTNASGLQQGKFAATYLLTSLGVPMMYEGQEIHRSKGSQVTDEDKNRLDWTVLSQTAYTNHFNYIAGLGNLRTGSDAFAADTATFSWAMGTSDWSGQSLSFFRSGGGETYLVVLNFGSTTDSRSITSFPSDGTWNLIANMTNVNTSGTGVTMTVSGNSGTVSVPAKSAYIYKAP